MSITPLITFKAGRCDIDDAPQRRKIKPNATPGYIYMFRDDFLHFCWRRRSVPIEEPEVDLLMMPADGHLVEYISEDNDKSGSGFGANVQSPTNGRIIILKFESSSQKYSFWLQSKTQHPSGDPSFFSRRDHRIIQIVNLLLDDQSLDIAEELRKVNGSDDENANLTDESRTDNKSEVKEKDDTDLEKRVIDGGDKAGNHGASPGKMSTIVQDFITSLSVQHAKETNNDIKSFLSLTEILSPSNTIPFIAQSCDSSSCDQLLICLPKDIAEPIANDEESVKLGKPLPHGSVIQQLSSIKKQEILCRVLRSPQLCQSLDSLSLALRRGGLLTVSEALGIELNDELNLDTGKALERISAIDIFLDGIKRSVEK